MTVAEIREYIDKKLSDKSTVVEDYCDTLIYIKYMLDKLEETMTNREYFNYKGITHTTTKRNKKKSRRQTRNFKII